MCYERGRLAGLRANLQRRAAVFELTRAFFREQGFLEVDTPVRVPTVAPEPHIVPFQSEDWLLATSPELHMKRLLAAGYEKLFQMSRCFRKGERGRHHNPEFTLLEWYRTGADYMDMIRDTERLVTAVAAGLKLGSTIRYRGREIDLNMPWPGTTIRDAFLQATGWDPLAEADLSRFDTDLVDRVMPGFAPGRPTVLFDYPAALASLARLKPSDPSVAERAEVFIGGLELVNAYSELTNPAEQRKRFAADARQIEQEQRRPVTMPESFLEAVDSLPQCGGIALGMDRLVMLFCDAESIDRVMPFTTDTA